VSVCVLAGPETDDIHHRPVIVLLVAQVCPLSWLLAPRKGDKARVVAGSEVPKVAGAPRAARATCCVLPSPRWTMDGRQGTSWACRYLLDLGSRAGHDGWVDKTRGKRTRPLQMADAAEPRAADLRSGCRFKSAEFCMDGLEAAWSWLLSGRGQGRMEGEGIKAYSIQRSIQQIQPARAAAASSSTCSAAATRGYAELHLQPTLELGPGGQVAGRDGGAGPTRGERPTAEREVGGRYNGAWRGEKGRTGGLGRCPLCGTSGRVGTGGAGAGGSWMLLRWRHVVR